jgi:hypothetical protein
MRSSQLQSRHRDGHDFPVAANGMARRACDSTQVPKNTNGQGIDSDNGIFLAEMSRLQHFIA